MDEFQIQMFCLIFDFDVLECNICKMGDYVKVNGMCYCSYGKMYKLVDVQKLQERFGGLVGVCCQKVSEVEVFVCGGIKDVLVLNQVCDLVKIDWLVCLFKFGLCIIVCVDDVVNIVDLFVVVEKYGMQFEIFVEIDCGVGCCGVILIDVVVKIVQVVDVVLGFKFIGIQVYQGVMQYIDSYEVCKEKFDVVIVMVKDVVEGLKVVGLELELVFGGGIGFYYFEMGLGVYNEL